ncbi:MAG: glycosyltransferase, partial [Planctomycetota bacterium]
MHVHLVHEWLAERAGSEMVVEAMLGLWPEAPLHALVYRPELYRDSPIARADVRTSFFQRSRLLRSRFRTFLGLMPLAVEQYDCAGADVIVSSSHAVAHGVVTRADQMHVSYVHSPMRYAWDLHHQYLRESGLTRGPKAWIARWTLARLRQWTRLAADRVDVFVANSHTVARRIAKQWRRRAAVIHPPVAVDRFRPDRERADFYLHVGRMAPYKRVDLIAAAATRAGVPLVLIGDGPDMARVRRVAGPAVRILGFQSDAVVQDHLERCRGLVFAAEEDFGIVPVEAMAAGATVLAFGRGGATETVLDGRTGTFFPEQSVDALASALAAFDR